MKNLSYLTAVIMVFFGLTQCQQPTKDLGTSSSLQPGIWRAQLALGPDTLPFTFDLFRSGERIRIEIINGAEQLTVNDVNVTNDSVVIRLPVFDSEIRAAIRSPESLAGRWHNRSKGNDYFIHFDASANRKGRFHEGEAAKTDFSGKWRVVFSPDTENEYPAIGEFRQAGNHLTGTFITETGDYRFLEGIVSGNAMKLSCFDGAHAFLFTAETDVYGRLNGRFYSGKHWQEPWYAERDETFTLRNPDELTFMKDGYDKIDFTFPNLEDKQVSLSDERFQNKVVIVQILGSWCPNCMDETRLFADYYRDYNQRGLEIIALAFERSNDLDRAAKAIAKFKTDLGAEYEFLIAGKANKKAAAEALPMLNHILSYPTSIFIDRTGKVRRIHTGFNGPGTGERYVALDKEMRELIEEMLGDDLED